MTSQHITTPSVLTSHLAHYWNQSKEVAFDAAVPQWVGQMTHFQQPAIIE